MSEYSLKLYITGKTARSDRAISSLNEICESELRNRYRLEVIDVLESPDLAEQDKILATPTLIKDLPPPIRRIIGDLSDRKKVLLGLDRPVDTHDLADGDLGGEENDG